MAPTASSPWQERLVAWGRSAAVRLGRLVWRGGANAHAPASISAGDHAHGDPCPCARVFGNNMPPSRSSSRQTGHAIVDLIGSPTCSCIRVLWNYDSCSRPVAREDKMPVSPIPCCRRREGAPARSRRGSRLTACLTQASHDLRGPARPSGINIALARSWHRGKGKRGPFRPDDDSARSVPGRHFMQVRFGHSERALARFGGRGRASFVTALATNGF